MLANIAILPGDGVGPEVMTQAVRVLTTIGKRYGHEFTLTEGLIGGAAIDATGSAFPLATRTIVQSAHATLLGAVGGPKWSHPQATVRPEQGLLELRLALGTYANLRPVTVHPALVPLSPLRPERLKNVDIMFVRELTGGLYFGEKARALDSDGNWVSATDQCTYTTAEVERIVRVAGHLARQRRKRVTSVDKANVLESSRLWRAVTTRIMHDEFPDVQVEHALVDAFAMHLLQTPSRFDVVVTENLFGDILTDEASVLGGSIGLLPSAALSAPTSSGLSPGLYEPIHGSAPDIAGMSKANPAGMILSVALLLRHSLGLHRAATDLESAVFGALRVGGRTADCALPGEQPLSTEQFGNEVILRIS